MEHFVTLFDRLYLPQGLALHMSMQRHMRDFLLWILCLDDETYEALMVLKLSHVRLLRLSEFETDELLLVKPSRTTGEYCWTLTPFAPKFVFESDLTVARVTYLDADMWFRKSPIEIFMEFKMSGKDVLITDHAYSPEYDQSATAGQYCVQFMTFTRSGGEEVRKWWEERCIEWCYARYEDQKFGDQKYLDALPIMFSERVHVLKNSELLLAPWNASRFPFGNAVAWHFHSFRILSNRLDNFNVWIGSYRLTTVCVENVYKPYLDDIKLAVRKLVDIGFCIRVQMELSVAQRVMVFLRTLGFKSKLWSHKQIIS